MGQFMERLTIAMIALIVLAVLVLWGQLAFGQGFQPPLWLQPPMPPPMATQPASSPFQGTASGSIIFSRLNGQLSQDGFPGLNLPETFGWNIAEPVKLMSFSGGNDRIRAGVEIIFPIYRDGRGLLPTTLYVNGKSFGPKDSTQTDTDRNTIQLSMTASRQSVFLEAPALTATPVLWPVVGMEFDNLEVKAKGKQTKVTDSTSDEVVEATAQFRKTLWMAGVKGETTARPIGFSYRAVYLLGDQATGWTLAGGVRLQRANLSLDAGYRLDRRSFRFDGGELSTGWRGWVLEAGVRF